MKRIVTVIVVWAAFCLTVVLGRDITSKAATKEELEQFTCISTEQNTQILSENNDYSSSVKKSKKNSKKNSKNSNSKKDISSSLTSVAISSEKQQDTDYDNAEDSKNIEKNKYKRKYTDAELRLMTCIIYCEARGESYAGQKAVGIVVMNRKNSDEFPDSIKKVIYQKGQFSPVKNGSLNKALSLYDKYDQNDKFKGEMPGCLKAAKEVLEGSTSVNVDGTEKDMKNYLFFSRYIPNAKYTLGNHQFK